MPSELVYPTTYPGRDVPTSFQQPTITPTTSQVPSTRIISWAFNTAGNTRGTVSSPKLRGPAIVKSVYYELDTGGDPPTPSFEIGYAPTIVSEAGVSLALAKPYTPFINRATGATQIGDARNTGFIHWSLYNVRTRNVYPLNQIVTLPEWYLTATLLNLVGFAAQCVGFAEVIEDVSPTALANFL